MNPEIWDCVPEGLVGYLFGIGACATICSITLLLDTEWMMDEFNWENNVKVFL